MCSMYNLTLYEDLEFNVSEGVVTVLNTIQDRLQIYKCIKSSKIDYTMWYHRSNLLQLVNPDFRNRTDLVEILKFDYYSHCILRYGYVKRRRWAFFEMCEKEWFRQRFELLTYEEQMEYMTSMNILPKFASEATLLKIDLNNPNSESYFEVNLFDAFSLLSSDKLYTVFEGMIYVPVQDLNLIMYAVFDKHMQEQRENITKSLRLKNRSHNWDAVLNAFQLPYFDLSSVKERLPLLSLKDLDIAAKEKFPPCMQHIYNTLRKDHFLLHLARTQWYYFLKNINVPLDVTYKLMYDTLCGKNNMSEKTWDYDYSYKIKHAYGKVGGEINYQCFSCKQLQAKSLCLAYGQGCPFKTFAPTNLESTLMENVHDKKLVNKMLDECNEKNYTSACKIYFHAVYKKEGEANFERPDQYYAEVCDIEDLI